MKVMYKIKFSNAHENKMAVILKIIMVLMSYHNFYKQTKYMYNKRVRPTKNEPQQGITYLEREREGVRDREGRAGRQTN